MPVQDIYIGDWINVDKKSIYNQIYVGNILHIHTKKNTSQWSGIWSNISAKFNSNINECRGLFWACVFRRLLVYSSFALKALLPSEHITKSSRIYESFYTLIPNCSNSKLLNFLLVKITVKFHFIVLIFPDFNQGFCSET